MSGKTKPVTLVAVLLAVLCYCDSRRWMRTLSAESPLHLENHLTSARIESGTSSEKINYGESWAGVSSLPWGRTIRRVLHVHAPGKIEYRIRIPSKGRLDIGLGALDVNIPIKFRIASRLKGADYETLLEVSTNPETPRFQRSVELSHLAGRTVILSLEAEAPEPGNVAFWATPIVSGERKSKKPNIVFYVIDGAAADLMSVYGYERRTARFIERLAAEGAVFENAYSNSSFTKVSTPSFMTSLHSSILGGHRSASDPLPDQAVTMAEHLHKAGYMTEILTSNPYCGRISGLERGVDIMVDTGWGLARPSSDDLHREFWRLYGIYPVEPFWVHIQPTDIHQPWIPHGHVTGLFAGPDDHEAYGEMLDSIEWNDDLSYNENISRSGIDQARFFAIAKNLYAEAMGYQDRTVGDFVGDLKRMGVWENTLFILASDHAHVAAGLPYFSPEKPMWDAPILASHKTRIPLIIVWPGKIKSGIRISQPVSMIDILPTILDLAGLPPADITQGQSLAPLLLGKRGWRPKPVVFDEFYFDGEYLCGTIEVIDGQWGASLRIDPRTGDKTMDKNRFQPVPLLLFDVREDPHALRSLHALRPDLVERYSLMLRKICKEHLELATKFSRPGGIPMTREQIETLRSLGYLR